MAAPAQPADAATSPKGSSVPCIASMAPAAERAAASPVGRVSGSTGLDVRADAPAGGSGTMPGDGSTAAPPSPGIHVPPDHGGPQVGALHA